MKIAQINFDETSGKSSIIIETPLGEFEGTAQLHEDDREYISAIVGCIYAEIRAKLKYLKAKRKEIKKELKVLQDFNNILISMKGYDKNSMEARRLRKEIYIKEKRIKELTKYIDNGYAYIKNHIKDKDRFHEKWAKSKKD